MYLPFDVVTKVFYQQMPVTSTYQLGLLRINIVHVSEFDYM